MKLPIMESEVSTTLEQQSNITLGLMSLFQPVVESIDKSVGEVQASQTQLRDQIELLQEELNKFQGIPDVPDKIESYVSKLAQARKKINIVNSILNQTQDRMLKLQAAVAKNTRRRNAELGLV